MQTYKFFDLKEVFHSGRFIERCPSARTYGDPSVIPKQQGRKYQIRSQWKLFKNLFGRWPFRFQPRVTENRVRSLDAIQKNAVSRWNNRSDGISVCHSPVIVIFHNPILGKVMEYGMLSVIFPFIAPHSPPWQGHKYTVSRILRSIEHCFSIFLWLKTKRCQCGIDELWSDLSITSREMKWASGKKIGAGESLYIKSFIQPQLGCMTSHPIKISFSPWIGEHFDLICSNAIKTEREEKVEYFSK